MKKETALLIFSLFIVLISMTSVFASDNATLDDTLAVSEVNTDNIISDSNIGTFDDLSDLINSDNDVIELKKDYKYSPTDSVAKSGIVINKSLTINGNGHAIDASNSVRIFIVNSSNVILNNIKFINANSSSSGGAIGADSFENLTVNMCNFSNNFANASGGAIFSYANNTRITNCNFDNNYAENNAGAVYLYGKDSVVDSSNFTSNFATYAGALCLREKNALVNNSIFESNEALGSGGAVNVVGTNARILNTKFLNNRGRWGGAIFSSGSYTSVDNTYFENNSVSHFGGAVYLYAGHPSITNSKFKSNKVELGSGGAIYSDDYYNTFENVTFEKNEANMAGAALALLSAHYSTVNNCLFDSNKVDHHGGGIYTNSYSCDITNSTFTNNYAASGSGIFLVYSETNTNLNSNSHIINSKFIDNTARYGGAGVSATSNAVIKESEFIGNSAGNYGGAVDLTNAKVVNSTFENNHAIYGGALFIHDSDVINSTFKGNTAEDGSAVYILNSSNLENNELSDDEVFLYADDFPGKVVSNTHHIQSLMTTDKGYFAYCSERFNLSPYSGVYDSSLEKLKNSINHQPVGEYLKILIYYYVDMFEDLRNYDFSDYVWQFTDFEYWNSTDPVVSEVVRLYDSGLRVSTENGCKVLSNGTLMYFNFSSLVTPSGQQNLFLFKFWHEDVINETLTKEALINKTVYLGDSVEYRIVINNKGKSPVYDNWVEDKDYSDGLIYKSWRAEVGDWTYNEQNGRWSLAVLEPGKSASIILTFGVTLDGLIYNNAISGLGVVNVTKSGAGFVAYNRNLSVEKRTVTPKVNIGDKVMFDIFVENTGNVTLDNVFVCESKYSSGLVYLDYISKVGTWKHSVNKAGKHVFTLAEKLEVEDSASFRVIFKAVKSGNFTNFVEAGFNDTTVSNSTNTTEVPGNNVPNITKPKSNKTSNNISQNGSGSKHNSVFKTEIDERATGNPLWILFAALILLPLRRFKN